MQRQKQRLNIRRGDSKKARVTRRADFTAGLGFRRRRETPRWENLRPVCYHSSKMAATRVTIKNNGSIVIEGDFSIHDESGAEYGLAGRERISLCRCGHSEKKPFCDGSHRRNGFCSDCTAYDLPEPVKKP